MKMTIRPELIDELLQECNDPREILSSNGLIKQLTKAIIERCLETEMEAHLGYAKYERRPEAAAGNSRNGSNRSEVEERAGRD
jgi:transposase-like protein